MQKKIDFFKILKCTSTLTVLQLTWTGYMSYGIFENKF